jgi:hypothetical protein
MNATAKSAFPKCWDACNEPATHVMTREGSIPLHACDRHTRIDREEAEGRGWTVTPLAVTQERPRIGERVTYKVGRHAVSATVTRSADETKKVGVVVDGDQTGTVRYVAPGHLVVQAPDMEKLHGRALEEDRLRAFVAELQREPSQQ